MSIFETWSANIFSDEDLDEWDEQDNIYGIRMNSFWTINIMM